jgi:hypothetical protein
MSTPPWVRANDSHGASGLELEPLLELQRPPLLLPLERRYALEPGPPRLMLQRQRRVDYREPEQERAVT